MKPEERCQESVTTPSDWARAKFHDGRCHRRWIEEVNERKLCRQHAEIVRRRAS